MTNLELKNIIEDGNLDLEDARRLYNMIEMQDVLSKYNFPTDPSSDGYYHIYVKDPTKSKGRRQLKSKDLNDLKQKVYNFEKYNTVNVRKTFKDIFNIVQDRKLKYVKNPEKQLSVSNTIKRDQAEYTRYFNDTEFEDMYIDEITEKDIENICYANLSKLDLHRKAFLYMRSLLKNVFLLAYQERWIDDNPYPRANFKKFSDMIVPSVPISERAHSEQEIAAILDYTHNKQIKQPYLVAPFAFELQILMGLRIGEVPALKWSDIKNDSYFLIHESQIIVKKTDTSKQYCKVVAHTKTWKDRKYPITKEILEFLKRLKMVQEKYYPQSKYLFPNRKDMNKPLHKQSINIYYQTMCKNLGIKLCKDARKGPHSFRRNAITAVVNNSGGNIIMASKLFGNSPKIADNNYYTGLDLDLARNVIEFGNQR